MNGEEEKEEHGQGVCRKVLVDGKKSGTGGKGRVDALYVKEW